MLVATHLVQSRQDAWSHVLTTDEEQLTGCSSRACMHAGTQRQHSSHLSAFAEVAHGVRPRVLQRVRQAQFLELVLPHTVVIHERCVAP